MYGICRLNRIITIRGEMAYYSWMKIHFEKLTANGASFLSFERIDSEFPFYWHYHPEFELTLILDSYGQRLVGDSIADYAPGDLVLLGPNLPHSWRSGPIKSRAQRVHRAVVVQFRQDFLGEHFFALAEVEPIKRLLDRSSAGVAFGKTKTGEKVAADLAKLPHLSGSRQLLTLLSILLDLAEEPNPQILSTTRVLPACRATDQQRIDAICKYLNRHYKHEIDFDRLARGLQTSQAALCRFFKRATGRTMTQYVNEIRVGAAAQLLKSTDQSILEIAFKVGFGNYSNFNRQFKRIKDFSPRELRAPFLSSPALAKPSRPANAKPAPGRHRHKAGKVPA
jgi:AraC-like DNA-binding protein